MAPVFVNTSDYLWTIDGEEVSEEEELIVSFAEEGDHTIELTATNDVCVETEEISLQVINVVSIEELSEMNFSYLINSGELIISWETAINGSMNFDLYDINGRLISSENISGENFNHVMNTQSLSEGMYILNVYDQNNDLFRLKFIR